MRLTLWALISGLLAAAAAGALNDRSTLHGVVENEAGKPVGHATVLIFHACPKRGYSIFCPSCYADCGKRTNTSADGSFSIRNLDPSLHFEILALGEGFEPTFVNDVDPMASVPAKAVLHARAAGTRNPRGLVRGRVVDDHGLPLRDVVVSVQGLSVNTNLPSQPRKEEETSLYFFGGTKEGLESVAVSNDRGEFEVSYDQPAIAMLLKIEGRAYAPKWEVVSTGAHRETIVLERGAAIRGRLLDHGKPVADAEIGIVPANYQGFGSHLKSSGDPYDEIRVGTQQDGTFVMADVPTPVKWLAYTKAESMGQRGSVQPMECTTARAEEVVDIGDLSVIPGHRLKGGVRVKDGGPVPTGLTVRIFSYIPRDSVAVPVRADGTFEFVGLPTARYDVAPETRHYRVTEPVNALLVDRDMSDLTITLEAVKK
jgi:hypothetical protein